jgi:uncharacterized protein YjbJ (UPF0337 family)
MGEADRNAQFEKMSGKVQTAKERTTAAWQKTRDELASDVANAKGKASEAAGHVKNRAETVRDEASEKWHEIRDKRRRG